jgi:hypothetical protein
MSERLKRKKEELSEVKKVIQQEQDDIKRSLPPIVIDTGGSIGNLNINTPAFKKWLVEVREKINPLIGKTYLSAAPEYSSKEQMVEKSASVEGLTDVFRKVLEKGASTFDPKDSSGPEAENSGDLFKINDVENKFIDIVIVENLTKKMSRETIENIEKTAIEELKDYYSNPEYITKIPIKEVIENYKNILLIEDNPDKKLLK